MKRRLEGQVAVVGDDDNSDGDIDKGGLEELLCLDSKNVASEAQPSTTVTVKSGMQISDDVQTSDGEGEIDGEDAISATLSHGLNYNCHSINKLQNDVILSVFRKIPNINFVGF